MVREGERARRRKRKSEEEVKRKREGARKKKGVGGKAKRGGNALNAVSIPHFSTTHGVAACLTASMFSHTQAKSVASHEVVPTASIMQGSAHSGKMEISCAEADEAAVARTRAAVLYFIVVVLRGGWYVVCVGQGEVETTSVCGLIWSRNECDGERGRGEDKAWDGGRSFIRRRLPYMTARTTLPHVMADQTNTIELGARERVETHCPTFREDVGRRAREGPSLAGRDRPDGRREASLFLNATSPRLSATGTVSQVEGSNPGKWDVAYDRGRGNLGPITRCGCLGLMAVRNGCPPRAFS
jgi:hypothetical protein